jgi:hypothetical protein
MAIAMLLGASAGYADDKGPSLGATQDWLVDHQNDFTSSCTFSNASQNSFTMTIHKVEIVLQRFDPNNSPIQGCQVHFYGNVRVEAYGTDNAYEATATFKAEDVSDVVAVRKLQLRDVGVDADSFNYLGAYCVVLKPKDQNDKTTGMTNLGIPYLPRQELNYIAIPISDRAMADRLAKALHHGIRLIHAQMTAKPEAF